MSIRSVSVGFELEGETLPVGRMALHENRALFEYDRAFLDKGLEPSPARLKALPGINEAPRRPFGGLHGLFADSLPDSYGRLLVDRRLRELGRDPNAMTLLDRLALVGRGGLGALVYAPSDEIDADEMSLALDLDRLQHEALEVIDGEPSALLALLQRLGGSAGGARPKALVRMSPDRTRLYPDSEETAATGLQAWIVKFRAPNDPADLGPIEHGYNAMARSCGLEVTDHHLFPSAGGAGYFATRRFDIGLSGRFHYHSLAGLLQAEPDGGALSYTELLRATRLLTRDSVAVAAAFRRMVFNVLAHNRDDHGKNHGFLMNLAGDWRLAPAFDLSFSHGPGSEHYLSVGGEGRQPTRSGMLALGVHEGLKPKDCRGIIDEVRDGISRWRDIAEESELSRARTAEIGEALVTSDRP